MVGDSIISVIINNFCILKNLNYSRLINYLK